MDIYNKIVFTCLIDVFVFMFTIKLRYELCDVKDSWVQITFMCFMFGGVFAGIIAQLFAIWA